MTKILTKSMVEFKTILKNTATICNVSHVEHAASHTKYLLLAPSTRLVLASLSDLGLKTTLDSVDGPSTTT